MFCSVAEPEPEPEPLLAILAPAPRLRSRIYLFDKYFTIMSSVWRMSGSIKKLFFKAKLRNISDDITLVVVCTGMFLNKKVFHFSSGNIGLEPEPKINNFGSATLVY